MHLSEKCNKQEKVKSTSLEKHLIDERERSSFNIYTLFLQIREAKINSSGENRRWGHQLANFYENKGTKTYKEAPIISRIQKKWT